MHRNASREGGKGGLLYFRHNSSTQPIRGADASIEGAGSRYRKGTMRWKNTGERKNAKGGKGERILRAASRRAAGEKKQHFSVWHP